MPIFLELMQQYMDFSSEVIRTIHNIDISTLVVTSDLWRSQINASKSVYFSKIATLSHDIPYAKGIPQRCKSFFDHCHPNNPLIQKYCWRTFGLLRKPGTKSEEFEKCPSSRGPHGVLPLR